MHRVVLSLATTVVALTACSSAADRVDDVSSNPTPAPASLAPPARATLPGGWFAEPLPGRTRPASVEAAGDRLVVGGSVGSGDGARPRLLAHEGSVWADVPLEPATGYGRIASLVHLAVAPDGGVVALGNATGGAHLMPRWTAWSGTLDGVAEVAQVFETFGGPSAGGLAGVTAAPVDAVVGSWATSPSRLSPAVWREDGGRWVRRTDIGPFSSAGDVQALPTAVGATGSAVVVVGTETVTDDDGTRQTAAAWTTPDLRTWRRLALGTSDGPSSGAVDVACAGDACLVAGWVGDRLAGWHRCRGRPPHPAACGPGRAVRRTAARRVRRQLRGDRGRSRVPYGPGLGRHRTLGRHRPAAAARVAPGDDTRATVRADA
ncbi:hypothetical protein KV102_05035 [Mumia sp. zg.B53]|uniref:hypothetical protein n=1 Tax=Mumia sp. zg.B53 TaxID=2855449 RepID=UPI001C6E9B2C|nr:hypothetical protein [Mumia sp. zg.B53]MBW9214200.1 hypothetical protein [Mumia sp. zg.B53]